jgi:hypothetical protein
METSTQNATPVALDRLVRHCCGSCIYHATGSGGGWGRFASPTNPRKTDWCVVCDHLAEGVQMAVHRYKWGGFRILPNDQEEPRHE